MKKREESPDAKRSYSVRVDGTAVKLKRSVSSQLLGGGDLASAPPNTAAAHTPPASAAAAASSCSVRW